MRQKIDDLEGEYEKIQAQYDEEIEHVQSQIASKDETIQSHAGNLVHANKRIQKTNEK